jgi:hypothetical protein
MNLNRIHIGCHRNKSGTLKSMGIALSLNVYLIYQISQVILSGLREISHLLPITEMLVLRIKKIS